jgi:hypothetical protein
MSLQIQPLAKSSNIIDYQHDAVTYDTEGINSIESLLLALVIIAAAVINDKSCTELHTRRFMYE